MHQILVNGQPHDVKPDTTVSQLLARLELAGKRLAVERNGEIVPKTLHAETVLNPGDQFEIVVAVGGG